MAAFSGEKKLLLASGSQPTATGESSWLAVTTSRRVELASAWDVLMTACACSCLLAGTYSTY